jgi:hypothetical protein
MPRLTHSVPKYRRHRASGQAVVTLADKDHYLGPHGTKASRLEYDRVTPSPRGDSPRTLTRISTDYETQRCRLNFAISKFFTTR